MTSKLDRRSNPIPRRIHFSGICGRVTGGLAIELKSRGCRITGTDAVAFPPMSGLLDEAGISYQSGPGPFAVPPGTELIITGSTPSGEETGVPAARRAGVPVMHLPAFLKKFGLGTSRRLVVAGTNGKTTTTAMLAWILESCGHHPDYLIGGRCAHFHGMVRLRGAGHAVLEGDEYFASLEEKIPKFHFYEPDVLLLTNMAYDHAEVFADEGVIVREFEKLTGNLPANGVLIAAGSPAVGAIAAHAACRVKKVGWTADCDVRLTNPQSKEEGMAFQIDHEPIVLKIHGRMNALNAALAFTAALECGVTSEQASAALADFEGVAGRCEILHDSPDLTVISDEGYHPMALRENLAALRLRYPHRRIVAVLQPRYTGGKGGFQHRDLPLVLGEADTVILTPVFDYAAFPGGALTSRTLAAAMKRRGRAAHVLSKSRHLPRFYQAKYQPGDVLFCSLAMRQEAVFENLLSMAQRLAPV